MTEALAVQIVRSWNGRNHTSLAAQLGLPRQCVYLAILMLLAERNWLLSLQLADVEFSAEQSGRLALLLDLIPDDQSPQDRAFHTAAQTPLAGEGSQCLCRAQPGGMSQSSAQGPQQ